MKNNQEIQESISQVREAIYDSLMPEIFPVYEENYDDISSALLYNPEPRILLIVQLYWHSPYYISIEKYWINTFNVKDTDYKRIFSGIIPDIKKPVPKPDIDFIINILKNYKKF